MDQYQLSGHIPCTCVYTLDWQEIMSWYPINGVSFLVRGIVLEEPLDVSGTICSSWQQDVGWLFISISTQHQHGEFDLGLCQGLDWREVMSWYSNEGATAIAEVRAQLERWDRGADEWPWWHWDLGGYVDGRSSQSLVWDLGIERSILGWVAWRCGITQWFVWDPSIDS